MISGEKRPQSNLPESEIAREFILRTMQVDETTPVEEEMEEDSLLGAEGYANKLFDLFKDGSKLFYRPEYRKIHLAVFPRPLSELDEAVIRAMEGNDLIFNAPLAGLDIEILRKTGVDPKSGELVHEATAFWVIDESRASIGIIERAGETIAIAKEKEGETFKFKPSLSSRRYLTEIAEALYNCIDNEPTEEPNQS